MCSEAGREGGMRQGQREKERVVREERKKGGRGELLSSESWQCAGSV